MHDQPGPTPATERTDAEDTGEAVLAGSALRRRGWFRRLASQRLTARIALLNLLGLIILVAGILYFNQFRQGLIDARVQSLTTQAQIIAAAVSGAATIDTGSIVIDPESLADTSEDNAIESDQPDNLDFPIDPETAGPVLKRLLANTTVRARVIDKDGNLIVDSRFLSQRGDVVQTDLPPLDGDEERFSTKALLQWVTATLFSSDYPRQPDYGFDNGKDFPEVAAALNGAKVSLVRLNDRSQIMVLVAVPIQRYRAVLGALVLSTTGGEIDDVLRGERQVVLMTFGFVALVAILLSILLASTIALPLRRLAAAADRVRRGINKRVEIPDFSSRGDEIGDLSGAVRDMTNALYSRIAAIEAFAADVSHELKNPLTSLRSAVETLAYARTDEQRERLVDIVKHDVKRLDRLITDISDASRLDAELARGEAQAFDLSLLLETIVSYSNDTRKDSQAEVEFDMAKPPQGMDRTTAYTVTGHDSRLGQVVRNLIDNARSFTRPDTKISIRIKRSGSDVEFRVEDCGPGISPDNLGRIFERFYTDRPEGSFGSNSGLGLSISQQIVDAHQGRIWAENRYGTPDAAGERPIIGARFTVRIPAAQHD